ncbi:MAG: hypothetical protein ACRCY3_04490, partial [Sphingorhabdus sp.]
QIQAILSTLNRVTETSEKTGDELARLDTQISQSASSLEERVTGASIRLANVVDQSRETAIPLFTDLDRHISDIEARIVNASATTTAQFEKDESRMSAMLSGLQGGAEKLHTTLSAHDEATQESIIRLSGFVEETRASLASLDQNATDRIAQMAFAVNALIETNDDLTEKLANNHALTTDFSQQSETLLEILRQANAEANDKLPDIFANLQKKLDANRAALADVLATIDAGDRQCGALAGKIGEIDSLLAAQNGAIAALANNAGSNLQGQQEQIELLSASLKQARGQIDDMVETASEQLVASMLRVRESTQEAMDSSRTIIDRELADVAGSITQRNRLALKTAVEEQVNSLDIAMRQSLERNLSFADEIEKRTAAQLDRLDEMASNLEQRVAHAHSSFAGLDDEGFSRRMALLTESLNSAAIDVAKILSNEVTDTAWAAYLKGDRGVFTRRAVRLLDTAEAKIIANNYDEDSEFRDNVNRYIHDFEAMMRVLLSTRDGNAIGVTLLSSDVGKLYVALAQAIERLRS